MTRHRVALRAGVITAVAAVVLTGLAAPAYADHDIRVGGIGNVELRVGEGARDIEIRVENRNGGGNHNSLDGTARNVQVTMTVPLTDVGVHVASAPPECNRSNNNTRMDCTIGEIGAGDTFSLRAQVGVHGNSPLQAGESRNGAAQVSLSTGGQSQFNVRVQGPDAPPAVAEVAGIVTDERTGEGIDGARVTLVDSQQTEHTTNTNNKGEYRFGADAQIAAGSIAVQASKDGYEGQPNTYNVQAGESLTDARLTLRNNNPPTPTDEPAETESPTPATSPTAVAAAADSDSSGPSFFTTLMIILGMLFLLLGIGAIVLLIIKRRRDQQEDDEGPEGASPFGPDPQGPPPGPGSRGLYHPAETQVMGPRGGPVPGVGPRAALADGATAMMPAAGPEAAAETTMLPRVGDPPGPRPPAPGMAGRSYGDGHTEVYDGSWQRQGGAPDRYDRPTQVGQAYEGPGSAGHWGAPGQAHGSPAARPEYGTPAGGQAYGSPAARPEYGAPAARPEYGTPPGRQAYRDPAYGNPSPSRHEQPSYGSGYDTGSYGPDPYTQAPHQPAESYRHRSGGHPDHGDYPQPDYSQAGHRPTRHEQPGYPSYPNQQDHGYQGYDQPAHQGYYDQTATQPRHAEPPSRHSEPAERRRLDWLDD